MAQNIHPEALKAFRKKRGWSQKELAAKCGCSPEQVSRWERGKILRVRSHSRGRLTNALGVSWEDLTQAPGFGPRPTVQLNIRVRADVPHALALVGLHYGVRAAQIIELAPLLFLINAEKSLARRQENLDAISELFDRATLESQKAAPHLAPAFYVRHETGDAIYEEQESINRRDVFNHGEAETYDVEDHDPYTTYLKTLVADLPTGLVEELSPSYRSGPRYTIAQDTLRKVTGISGDNETEQELLDHINCGDLSLREVLSKKQELSREKFSGWLSDQHEALKAEQDAAQRSALDKLLAQF